MMRSWWLFTHIKESRNFSGRTPTLVPAFNLSYLCLALLTVQLLQRLIKMSLAASPDIPVRLSPASKRGYNPAPVEKRSVSIKVLISLIFLNESSVCCHVISQGYFFLYMYLNACFMSYKFWCILQYKYDLMILLSHFPLKATYATDDTKDILCMQYTPVSIIYM